MNWLMKTEPDTFSYDDLLNAPHATTAWEGVRNYQARNFMRDQFKEGDSVFIYHSSCAVPGIVGTATVVREAYPDPTALDKNSPYFDAVSLKQGASRWWHVDVKAQQKFSQIITLQELKKHQPLQNMLILRPGNRLSITPVTDAEWDFIMTLAK